MAKETSDSLKNLIIYSVYIRSHTPEGNFQGIYQGHPQDKEAWCGCDLVYADSSHWQIE